MEGPLISCSGVMSCGTLAFSTSIEGGGVLSGEGTWEAQGAAGLYLAALGRSWRKGRCELMKFPRSLSSIFVRVLVNAGQLVWGFYTSCSWNAPRSPVRWMVISPFYGWPRVYTGSSWSPGSRPSVHSVQSARAVFTKCLLLCACWVRSSDPASAFQSAGIVGMSHHTRPSVAVRFQC